ncbi:MAG: hypothetical protein ACI3Y5_01105 [Prevotella sp.]
MDNNISQLLRRFMAGGTSLEEEAWLQRFFDSATEADRPADIPADDWHAYREMFAMFRTDDTDDAASDAPAASCRHESPAIHVARPSTSRRSVLWSRRAGVAAAVAALVLIGGAVWRMSIDTMPQECHTEMADAAAGKKHARQRAAETHEKADTAANRGGDCHPVESIPKPKEGTQRVRRSKYMLPVEKNYMAMAAEAKAALADSLHNISQSEADLDIVMQALYVKQALQIEEITNNSNTLSSVIYE